MNKEKLIEELKYEMERLNFIYEKIRKDKFDNE